MCDSEWGGKLTIISVYSSPILFISTGRKSPSIAFSSFSILSLRERYLEMRDSGIGGTKLSKPDNIIMELLALLKRYQKRIPHFENRGCIHLKILPISSLSNSFFSPSSIEFIIKSLSSSAHSSHQHNIEYNAYSYLGLMKSLILFEQYSPF